MSACKGAAGVSCDSRWEQGAAYLLVVCSVLGLAAAAQQLRTSSRSSTAAMNTWPAFGDPKEAISSCTSEAVFVTKAVCWAI